jgi:monoamine oxidase
VRSITQREGRVTVQSENLVVEAAQAIVAVPPALALEINFDPVLSTDRLSLYRQAVAGFETKTMVVYDEAFWRADGLSGQAADPGSVVEVTLDASPPSGRPGVLAGFAFSHVALEASRLPEADRSRAVIEALVHRFGPKASSPQHMVQTRWWEQPWSRGCSMAHLPPGALTQYGHLLREPFGSVHWAGTETATQSHGAIDGAIRSGLRAAAEVLDL